MKVIHGMSEVAGQGIYTVMGLRKNGVDAHMAVWSRNPSGYPIDIDLKVDKKKKYLFPAYAVKMLHFALKASSEYDILHSHFGYSLLPYNIDVSVLKKRHKKIFAEFHGSDIRNIFNRIQYKYISFDKIDLTIQEKNQKHLMRLLNAADGVILHDAELIQHLPKIDIPVYIVPLRIDLTSFTPVYPEATNKDKPIIVHAPSKRKGKGTKEILDALMNVKREFELILVEGKKQSEALKLYQKADIIIDQISVGTYGVFAIEAMALGKPVITYISDEFRETFPKSLPIVSAEVENLTEIIEDMIDNSEKRRQLGIQGREYVLRYHDNIKVTKYLKQIYEGTIEKKNLFELL
mgnify:CR=1 FL=1